MGNGASRRPILSDMNLKMVLVGSAGSGKSSVFTRITANQFSYHYTQTASVKIGNIVKKINVPVECKVSLALWDLPGMEDIDLRKSYYNNIDGAVIVVNINDLESIREVSFFRNDLLDVTKTSSKLATFESGTVKSNLDNNVVSDTHKQGLTDAVEKTEVASEDAPGVPVTDPQCNLPVCRLVDIPTLLLGNKVDKLEIEPDQEELHPNVVALLETSQDTKCTGCVPVSAKQNDRSIDLAFTAFLRFLVEKKLDLAQSTGTIKVAGLSKAIVTNPSFVPPRTAATQVREKAKEVEDANLKRLPLINYDVIDTEYEVVRQLIGKIRRGHKDWGLSYRRFRKATVEYKVAPNTSCSVEELILNIKSRLPENALRLEEFQGWVKLTVDEEIVDTDDVEDDLLEVLDTFNYELVPNANYVATIVKNAQISVVECKLHLSELKVPLSSVDQAKLNNKEINLLLSMCEECVPAVDAMRKSIELAVMW